MIAFVYRLQRTIAVTHLDGWSYVCLSSRWPLLLTLTSLLLAALLSCEICHKLTTYGLVSCPDPAPTLWWGLLILKGELYQHQLPGVWFGLLQFISHKRIARLYALWLNIGQQIYCTTLPSTLWKHMNCDVFVCLFSVLYSSIRKCFPWLMQKSTSATFGNTLILWPKRTFQDLRM